MNNIEYWVKSYQILCFTATLTTVSWCVYNFLLNEDVSLVGFQKFQANYENLYPMLTICIINPILNKKLKEYGMNSNTSSYQSFLKGDIWDPALNDIDYNNVTIDLVDYFLYYEVVYMNLTYSKITYDELNNAKQHSFWRPPYVSIKDYWKKCCSVDIPYLKNKRIRSLKINLKKELFMNRTGITYKNWNFDNTKSFVSVILSYPHQTHLAASRRLSFRSIDHHQGKSYTMEFTIGNVEVLQRRDKWNDRYEPGIANYDHQVVEEIVNELGCYPPYWKSMFPAKHSCTSIREIQEIRRIYDTVHDDPRIHYLPPCRIIESLQSRYVEHNLDHHNTSSNIVTVKLIFQQQKFKEIKMVKYETFSSI